MKLLKINDYKKRILLVAASAAMVAAVAGAGVASASLSHPEGNGSHVTGIAFSGNSASAPVVTVTGTGFGHAPVGQPSSDGGCGYGTGYDYGESNLWIADATGTNATPAPELWSAGESINATNRSSCLGLFITSWTAHQAVFSFGSRYGTGSGNHWVLRDGDALVVDVKGTLVYATVPAGF